MNEQSIKFTFKEINYLTKEELLDILKTGSDSVYAIDTHTYETHFINLTSVETNYRTCIPSMVFILNNQTLLAYCYRYGPIEAKYKLISGKEAKRINQEKNKRAQLTSKVQNLSIEDIERLLALI